MLLSDNGPTFQAAATELTYTCFHLINFRETGTQRYWVEIYPQTCPMVWGILVMGLTKLAFKKILGRTYATLEGLQTIVIEIEALLNDRPLMHVSPDLRDPETITPSLYGKRITTLPNCTIELNEADDPDFGDTTDI